MYNWSSPNSIDPVRARFNAQEWVDLARTSGAGFVYFMAKMDDGLAYYDTAVRESKTQQDFLVTLVPRAQKAGLKVGLYYAAALDGYQGDLHPEWRLLTKDGKTADADGSSLLNLLSPYRGIVLNQLRELSERFSFGCIWFDWPWYFLSDDAYSQAAFQKAFGKPVFRATPAELEKFHVATMVDFLTDALRVIHNNNPSVLLAVNSDVQPLLPRLPPEQSLHRMVTPEYLQEVEKLAGFQTVEGHTSRRESTLCKYFRSRANGSFEIGTTTGYNGDWGRTYTLKPSQLLELETAVVTSQSGNIYVGVQPFPDGYLQPDESHLVEQMGAWVRRRRSYLSQTQPVADVAIVVDSPVGNPLWPAWSGGTRNRRDPWGDDLRRLRPWPYHGVSEESFGRIETLANGFELVLLENHIPFELVRLETDLSPFRLVILQDGICLSSAAMEAIRRYVTQGGQILAEGHSSLLAPDGTLLKDFGLADVFGVSFEGYSPHADANYALVTSKVLANQLLDYPILIRGGAILARATTAREEAKLIYPMVNIAERPVFRWGVHNPPGAPADYPILVSNRVGEGRAFYFSGQLSDHIAESDDRDPWSKQMLLNIIQQLVGNPVCRASLPKGVELVLNRQAAGRYVVHLLNHNAALGRGMQVRVGSPGPGEVWLNLDRLGQLRRAWLAPEGTTLDTHREDRGITTKIPMLDPVDTILVLE
jgi:hypothetical protein